MKTNYQYRLYPSTDQAITLNRWLRICRYWYNRMLGDRLDWWEKNRCPINACPLICHLPELKDRPNYYTQKKQLPVIKDDLTLVKHSGELLDFSEVYSTILQQVCKRVEEAFSRYIKGDCNGKRSGKPRFKNGARYRTMVFDSADNNWLQFCTINGRWLYLKLPKIGLIKVRTHRPLPDGVNLKQVSVIKKTDGWHNEDVYLATSEGEKLPSLKPLRKKQEKLTRVSQKKHARKRGSKRRRKLAKREGRLHQQIARSRKDFQYKTAHRVVRSGKKVFFWEELNLKGLTKRNAPKQDDWDEVLKLWVDRDINAAINLKRVGLDVFPTIKRRKGNPVVVTSATNSTLKEVLTALFRASETRALL